MKRKTIAILTGGGHVATLNHGVAGAIIEAKKMRYKVKGVLEGWKGMEKGFFVDLNLSEEEINHLLGTSGTILKSSRTKPDLEIVNKNMKEHGIDALIALGGEDTLSVANELYKEFSTRVVGWPKTMDNDLSSTYFCFGYPTAIKKASDCVRESFDTAYAHNRAVIITMFGRNTDWVVLGAGAYGDADLIIPAEKEIELDDICERILESYYKNNGYCVLAVAEGAKIKGLKSHIKEERDAFQHEKLDPLALAIILGEAVENYSKNKEKGIKTALISLTYQLRNGAPIYIDKKLAIEAGRQCVKMIDEGNFGSMASVIYDDYDKDFLIGSAPLEQAMKRRNVRDSNFFDYEKLTPTEEFYKYAEPILGKKEKSREYKISLK